MGSFEDLIKGKSIWDVKQIETKFTRDDPRPLFRPHYRLGGLHGYYRRGDYDAYEQNFIPIWFYGIFLEEQIFWLRPCRDEKEFFNYSGVTLKQLLRLIKLGLVVPLVADNFRAYPEKDEYVQFFRNLPEDKPLIRSHLFEDAYLKIAEGRDTTFPIEMKPFSEKFQSIVSSYSNQQKKQYTDFAKDRPLAPKDSKHPKNPSKNMEALANWLAERALWQHLNNSEENVETIQRVAKSSPLEAYSETHKLHYFVVPKFYSRYGFSFMAEGGEDDFIASSIERLPIRSNFPSNGELLDLSFRYPVFRKRASYKKRAEEVEKSLDLLERVLKEGKLRDTRQKVMENVARLRNTKGFYENMESIHSESAQCLEDAISKFNCEIQAYMDKHFKEELQIELDRRQKRQKKHKAASFAATGASIGGLLSGLLPLAGAAAVADIFFLVRGIREEERLNVIRSELESIQKEAKLSHDWIDAPFIVIDYPNPI